jgi:hypothetical protein
LGGAGARFSDTWIDRVELATSTVFVVGRYPALVKVSS